MDTIGSIQDVSMRILPSKKLEDFMTNLKLRNDTPSSIRKYIAADLNQDSLNKHASKVEDNKSYLKSKDLTLLKSILKTETDEKIIIPEVKEQTDIKEKKEKNDAQKALLKERLDFIKENCDFNIENLGLKMEHDVSGEKTDVKEKEAEIVPEKIYLSIRDLEWLSTYLEALRNDGECIYLHELLEGSDILLPENEVIKRNPQLEARCVRLRKEQSNRVYRSMTKNVDNVRVKQPEETIAYQLKGMNRQLIAIGQFVLSVGAGFLFGFTGVELMIGSLDFGFRLLLGVMCALIIALAEIYFLAKKLNEDLSIGDTIQLGGPPVYPGDAKEHKD